MAFTRFAPGVLAVEARVATRPRATIPSIEREEANRSVALDWGLEGAREHDADARRPIDPAGHVPPGAWCHEDLERLRGRVRGGLPLRNLKPRDGHARPRHSSRRMHDGCEPETQTCTSARNAERNDDAPAGLAAHLDNQSSASRRMFIPLVVSTDST